MMSLNYATPKHLWGGEFHYWRTPPEAWGEVFDSIVGLRFNTVSTYVPWDFHEVAPGRFDFNGRRSAARDLIGWLKLAKARGLQVILRPGPFIYAEWNHKGPPARIAKHARLSKPFLNASRHWIMAVSKAVAPYMASCGGPIVAVQVCNEVTGAFEYDSFADAKFKEIDAIYRRRYGVKMPRVRAHWGGGHLDVGESGTRKLGTRSPFRKAKWGHVPNFLDFHEWYTEEYLRKMRVIFRDAGFDVPLFANVVSWYWPMHWSAMQQSMDFVAMDTYYPNLLPGNLPAAFIKLYRQFCGVTRNPIAGEFGCGVWDTMHDRLGWPDERHLELTTLLALSQGVRGISYYMLVNRDNWYLSPVNEWGKVRTRFVPIIKSLGKIMQVLSQGDYRSVSSVGLVWDRRDHRDFVVSGKKFDHNAFGHEWFGANAYEEDYPEFWNVFQSLLRDGYDVQIVEAGDGDVSWPRATVFPVTARWDSGCEELARRHLKRGGCLILIGDNAADIALKMPPSIGTPVQKWVRDLPGKDQHRAGEALRGLGEKTLAAVEGKNILQFARKNARGDEILFVFSLAEKEQTVRVLDSGLREIATGKIFSPGGKIMMAGKSGKVFYSSRII